MSKFETRVKRRNEFDFELAMALKNLEEKHYQTLFRALARAFSEHVSMSVIRDEIRVNVAMLKRKGAQSG